MKKLLSSLLFLTFLFLSVSCKNESREKELALKQKELDLKEKELQLKEDSIKSGATKLDNSQLNKNLVKESESDSSLEKLIGYWFVPHSATINIRFYRNKQFVFNDYNSSSDKQENLTGRYELSANTLTLYYNDRPKQKFRFYKGSGNDDNYYIKSSGYYFVKGENGD